MSAEESKLGSTITSLAELATKVGLPDQPSGIVLLYPDQAQLTVLLGEFTGDDRYDLGQALMDAAEDLL